MQEALFHFVLASSILMGVVFLALMIGSVLGERLDRKRLRNRRLN
ncbi:hypothetical protein LptCag_1494 [Leptospirillum ferriphilum]|uniref:Uncharacterized protein n=1 Tax=Leptospirillum ferriphilum TaxID=178606 RepID=A0A094X5F3_9BACT|nr:hypothetical protein LptCag_1494 [Leptospirillum ferriphilum]